MIMHINDTGMCWICGRDTKIMTSHHALPKHLNPVNNIIVPVCEECHDRINADDINGMFSYLFKIKKTIKENVNSVNVALNKLNSMQKMQEEKQDAFVSDAAIRSK